MFSADEIRQLKFRTAESDFNLVGLYAGMCHEELSSPRKIQRPQLKHRLDAFEHISVSWDGM
jgi:hypothetical protein